MANYPWYGVANKDAPLEQGDFLFKVPLILPVNEIINPDSKTVNAEIGVYDVIVMSQSCDLVPKRKKITVVQLAPIYTFAKFTQAKPKYAREEDPEFNPPLREKLRRGEIVRYFMLDANKFVSFPQDKFVVDLGDLQSARLSYVQTVAATQRRLRLLPPYRGQLSQHLARYFMRVGLPNDIPKFLPAKKLDQT